jgi:hypothetical protein
MPASPTPSPNNTSGKREAVPCANCDGFVRAYFTPDDHPWQYAHTYRNGRFMWGQPILCKGAIPRA